MSHSLLYAGGADSVDVGIMDKGGSLTSRANSQVQDLRVATKNLFWEIPNVQSSVNFGQ